MFFSRMIKWFAGLPGPYALGLLWWGEATILLCSLAGGHLLSTYLFENLSPTRQQMLFALALLTWFLVFYLMHTTFGKTSQMMEALIDIHRQGGLRRVESLLSLERQKRTQLKGKGGESEPLFDPFKPPERVRASAEVFRIRYFVVLPTSLVLYLLGFASTIYRIFARQILTWEPGYLVLPAAATAVVGCACFWLLMPLLPGYVSVRGLLGHKRSQGE